MVPSGARRTLAVMERRDQDVLRKALVESAARAAAEAAREKMETQRAFARDLALIRMLPETEDK